MLFSSEGFKGMLNELKSEGYLFRYDKVICDRVSNFSNALNEDVKEELLELGVYDEYLTLPISCVKMFFSNQDGTEKVIKLHLGKNSQLIMNLYSRCQREIEDIEYKGFVFNEDFTEHLEEYPEKFDLLLNSPFFVFILKVDGFLFENWSLWCIFGNDRFINSCDSYGRCWFRGLDICCSYELINELALLKIHYYDSIIYDAGMVMRYSDADENQYISIMVVDGKLNVWYEDVYTGKKILGSMLGMTGYPVKEEENIINVQDGYTIGGVKNNGMLLYSKYKNLMINTDELNPKYLYSDIDISSLMNDLSINGYELVSNGATEYRSIRNSISVYGMMCSEFSKNKYVYVGFYFDVSINDIVVELRFSDKCVNVVTMNGINVTMISVGGYSYSANA